MRRSSIFHSLIYGKPVELREYELTCLRAVGANLPSATAWKLEKQLQLLRWRYRQTLDRVLLFLPESEDSRLPEEVLFANRGEEVLIASLVIGRTDKEGHNLRARMFGYQGHISSIQFDRSPSECGLSASVPTAVRAFTMVRDPDSDSAKGGIPVKWSGVVEEWNARVRVVGLAPPLSGEEQRLIQESMPFALPDDYLDVVRQAEGVRVGPVQILGLGSLRIIPVSEGELVVLGEIENKGTIAIAADRVVRFQCDTTGEQVSIPEGLGPYVLRVLSNGDLA